MLTSTLLEMDFSISYWLILVFILEAFKHQLIVSVFYTLSNSAPPPLKKFIL